MILRQNWGGAALWLFAASLILSVHSDVLEPTHLSSPNLLSNEISLTSSSPSINEVGDEQQTFQKRTSIVGSDVVSGARNLDSRIDTSLGIIRNKIPDATVSVEADIAVANRDRVILALSNFLGMVFGVLKTTGNNWNFEDLGTGDRIQVIAQILYGYGYWAPFAFEFEKARVDCGAHDLEKTLTEYGYVTDYNFNSLDPILNSYYVEELNSKLKENLYCLTSKSSSNQAANELDTYLNVYTQLLGEKLGG